MGETDNVSITLQSDEQSTDAAKTYQAPVTQFMQGEAKGKDALTSFGMLPNHRLRQSLVIYPLMVQLCVKAWK